MKKTAPLLLAALLAAASIGTAQADWGHRGQSYYRDYRPPMHQHGHRHGGSRWIGPAAVLAITGMAIGASVYNRSYIEPAPVIYTAPPPPQNSMWYYCGSSGQYYPYTNACPEGWQAVPAR